jgi:inhibitor of KinA sporulation pathway (predicted exonuclease)
VRLNLEIFLIDLRLLATCDNPTQTNPQEIIEFPIVVIDVKQRKVVAEFQNFVRPVVHAKLSAFCTELTGITQAQVDKGIPLKDCIARSG